MAKAIFVDTTKCTGCRACQVSCKQWNELPAEKTVFSGSYQTMPDTTPNTFTLVKFKEVDDGDSVAWFFRKHQCMQCTEATCIKVCPVQGITKHPEGFKVRDLNKCIGCGMCVTMCPFSVPKLDEKEKKVRDCVFCINRIVNGMLPACVKTCPSGALKFGQREDILSFAQQRLQALKDKFPDAYLYGEKELGGLGVLTIIAREPAIYDLPEKPKMAKEAQWLRDMFDSFVIAKLDTSMVLDWIANYLDSIQAPQKIRV